MEKVIDGKFVSVDYTGTLQNGDVFDSSKGRQPLEVHMGAGQMIPGFENALQGMSLNEKKTFTLTAAEAYGERDESRTQDYDRKVVPPSINPHVGRTVVLSGPNGQQIPATIAKVTDTNITLDFNHPLAGKSLTFEVEVVGISDTTTQAVGCGCGCDSECDTPTGCGCS
ncbi:MAG: peptidylprolyl isomerase [Syntrophales bacterium]